MRNAAPCALSTSWPAPRGRPSQTAAATVRNATEPSAASWSACRRSTASPSSSVRAPTLCAQSGGGKPSSHRAPTRRRVEGRRGWGSPTASACRTTAHETSCVGMLTAWTCHCSRVHKDPSGQQRQRARHLCAPFPHHH